MTVVIMFLTLAVICLLCLLIRSNNKLVSQLEAVRYWQRYYANEQMGINTRMVAEHEHTAGDVRWIRRRLDPVSTEIIFPEPDPTEDTNHE